MQVDILILFSKHVLPIPNHMNLDNYFLFLHIIIYKLYMMVNKGWKWKMPHSGVHNYNIL